jgi:hypothetical protein
MKENQYAHLTFLYCTLIFLESCTSNTPASKSLTGFLFFSKRKGSDMASFHFRTKSGKKGTAAAHAAYISREGSFSKREDLVASGYGNMPDWAKHPIDFWRAGDKFERENGAVYREHEIALPAELTETQQLELTQNIIEVQVGGKPFQYAVHQNTSSLEGVPNAHLHLMFSDRMDDGIERTPEQTFRRYNAKHPEQGGCRKDSGGMNSLELRDQMIETRRQCAELQNATLARYGHDARVDHRTLKAQGIERQPERHLGPARLSKMSAEEKVQFVSNRQANHS